MTTKRKLGALVFLLLGVSLATCDPGDMDCDHMNSMATACSDTVPVNEVCDAAFQRWFYDKATASCKEVAYSGCSMKGFETQGECEACRSGKGNE